MTDRSRKTMRQLIAEAEQRGIAGAEWMDREALLRALADGERRAGGALARARRFLGEVTGIDRMVRAVRGVIESEESAGENASASASASASESASESASASGSGSASASASASASERATGPAVAPLVPANDPSFGGIRVVHRDGSAWLVWRAPTARIAAIGRGSELTLRLVSVGCAIGQHDAEVIVETADEPGLALEGVRAVPDLGGRPCVSAIGVGRGEHFVAVAHARVA
jgi:hypothetical protein